MIKTLCEKYDEGNTNKPIELINKLQIQWE